MASWDEIITTALRDASLERFTEPLLRLCEPCLRFTTRPAAVAVGASKLGGAPDLPPDLPWPGEMTFLAQLDLAEVARLLPSALPQTGVLAFFYDRTDFYVGERACRVLHVAGELTRRPVPDAHERLRECALDFVAGHSLPELRDGPFLDVLGPMSDAERDALRDLDVRARLGAVEGGHQLLGHVERCIQDDVLLEHATLDAAFASWTRAEQRARAREYRQLLVLDGDANAELEWVDAGSCWFLIRPDDLARGAFERTSSVVQFC